MTIIEKAKEFARIAHKGQVRKLTNEPYFTHLEGVGTILKEAELAEEIIAAGYLHDTVEDTNVTLEEIRNHFGDEIARIVEGNTENKVLSWEERKQHTIESIVHAPFSVKALIGADKLDNITSIIVGIEKYGETIWQQFKRGKEKQIWYYSSIANNLLESTGEASPKYFYELKEKVDRLK